MKAAGSNIEMRAIRRMARDWSPEFRARQLASTPAERARAEFRRLFLMRRNSVRAAFTAAALAGTVIAQGTLTGNFKRAMSSQPVSGATLTLTLSQYAIAAGSFAVVPQSVSCYTSTQGNVVGIPDPSVVPVVSASTASGSLAGGNYFVEVAYVASGVTSLASPEMEINLGAPGQLTVTAPTTQPASATGYAVYIGTTSGSETLQGTVAGWSNFIQASALASGAALPNANTSACSLEFNDSLIPSTTWYAASLADASGAVLPGFPQNWQLAGSSVNVANIVPIGYNPAVNFPQPVLQNPASSNDQSVNSGLNLNNHAVNGSSNVGPGVYSAFYAGTMPAAGTLGVWTPNVPVDVTRLSVYAEAAGVGAGTSTFAITDGTNTCTFPAMLSGAAPSGSSNAPTGVCLFSAGVALTLKSTADSHGTAPGNLSFQVETVSQ